MKAFKLLAYVAALGCGSLMGCAPKPASHYSVYIDPTMNASDTDAMLSALQSWEQSVPVTFDVTIGAPFGKEEHTIVITCTTIAQVRLLAPGSGDIGVTRRNASTDVSDVYYGCDLDSNSTFHVEARHELGHTGAGSLMCANRERAAENITSTDINQWESLR